MYISKNTQHQLDRLAAVADLTPAARSLLERIVAKAVCDATCDTLLVCRFAVAELLAEQRAAFHEQLRRPSSC